MAARPAPIEMCIRDSIHVVGQTQLADNGTDSLGGDHRVGVLFVQDQFADAGFDIRQDFGAVRIDVYKRQVVGSSPTCGSKEKGT